MILFSLLGLAAGFLNAISGGGGLITLPILLWAGLPPISALATNKFQSMFGTLSSSIHYFRHGYIDFQAILPAMIFVVLASAAGTWGVQQLPTQLLNQLIPYFLIATAAYTWSSPRMNDIDSPPRLRSSRFNIASGISIGLYGGFFGPGMGAIAAVLFASLLGYNLRKATAHAKPLVLLSNSTSLIIFIGAGEVYWALGLSMAATQLIGARLGANLVITRGSTVIKPLLLTSTILIAVMLLLSS